MQMPKNAVSELMCMIRFFDWGLLRGYSRTKCTGIVTSQMPSIVRDSGGVCAHTQLCR